MISVTILNTCNGKCLPYVIISCCIFLAAPKPQVKHVPALQEHASEYFLVCSIKK